MVSPAPHTLVSATPRYFDAYCMDGAVTHQIVVVLVLHILLFVNYNSNPHLH